MLNWPADYKATLGNDVRLIARTKRVFAHALDAIEEELLESAAAAKSRSPPPRKRSQLSQTQHKANQSA